MIFNGAIEAAKEEGLRIATGTYKGNGGYGNDSPTKISCPFLPRMLYVYVIETDTSDLTCCDIATGDVSTGVLTGNVQSAKVNIGSNARANVTYHFASEVSYENGTIKIVATGGSTEYIPKAQMNRNGWTYAWIAIG